MQKNYFSFSKTNWLRLAVAFLVVFSISSCKEPAPDGANIALTSKKINKEWVKPGHLKDIDYLTFITLYNPITHKISVGVQAYKKDYTPIGSFIDLPTGNGWKDTLPPIAVGRNNINLSDLGILDNKGGLKDFKYVNLIPFADENSFLAYNTVVIDNQDIRLTPYQTYPCPPCPNCKPVCEGKKTVTDAVSRDTINTN